MIYWDDMDFGGADYAYVNGVNSADKCTQLCFDDADCHAFTYVPERGHCYKKQANGYRISDQGLATGGILGLKFGILGSK